MDDAVFRIAAFYYIRSMREERMLTALHGIRVHDHPQTETRFDENREAVEREKMSFKWNVRTVDSDKTREEQATEPGPSQHRVGHEIL